MPKVAVRLLMCALIVAGAVTISPIPQVSTEATIPSVGAQAHLMWGDYTDAERIAVVNKMADAGLTWLRIDFGWASIQPVDGASYEQWYFDRADLVVNAARARGMKVLLTFWRTPNWANNNMGVYAPPNDPNDFARAARYTAEYFKGRVDAYEIWNEPNLEGGGFWTGTIAQYADLLKASYDDFKAVDPSIQVVAGSVVYNDDAWLKAMYEAGAGGYFDVISTHPYQGIANEAPELPDDGTKWRLTHVSAVHNLMVAYGDGSKPIWFTEFGWSNHENYPGLDNWQLGVTDQQQADYFVRAIEHVAENHPYVENMFWYNDRNQVSGKIQLDNYGLLYRDLSPKLVFDRAKAYLTSLLPPPTASPAEENLLTNGGFESGSQGWTAKNASLGLASRPHRGEWGGRLTSLRPKARFGTTSGSIPVSIRKLSVSGHVKSRRAGRVVRISVKEVVNGRVILKRFARFRTQGSWQRTPVIDFPWSGRSGARVRIGIHLGLHGPKRLVADSFRVGPPRG